MAPAVTTNSTLPVPSAEAFQGDEFSNNLFSDLAPLLTLFGEQVSKQFLSMSMGWADDILLATGPLGIMTIVVSAIRVSKLKILKAFIGRARESRANAEKEILSSTSEDVCELWSGREIVRELGHAEGMRDIILLHGMFETNTGSEVDIRVRQAAEDLDPQNVEDIRARNGRVLDIGSAVASHILSTSSTISKEEMSEINTGSPNIALNVRNATVSHPELVAWAVFGTILQISALAFPAVSTDYLGWKKGDSDIAAYGYPCFAFGTAAVCLGLVLCGRVIEGSTTEHNFELNVGNAEIMRLQKACTVSDQHFPACAIFNASNDPTLRTSRRNNAPYSRIALVATLIVMVGFVIQFVGLRALHWSATVYQLGVMLIMTIVRALVRRGLSANPIFYPLLDGHEMAWLTLYMLSKADSNNDPPDPSNIPLPSLRDGSSESSGSYRYKPMIARSKPRQLFEQKSGTSKTPAVAIRSVSSVTSLQILEESTVQMSKASGNSESANRSQLPELDPSMIPLSDPLNFTGQRDHTSEISRSEACSSPAIDPSTIPLPSSSEASEEQDEISNDLRVERPALPGRSSISYAGSSRSESTQYLTSSENSFHRFTMRPPFIRRRPTAKKFKDRPKHRMLQDIVRLEPLSGYLYVNELRKSLDRDISALIPGAFRDSLKDTATGLESVFTPIDREWELNRMTTTLCDNQFLYLCRDLENLAPSPIQARDTASALALALGSTMNMLRDNDEVLWRSDRDPFWQASHTFDDNMMYDEVVPAIRIVIPIVSGLYRSGAEAELVQFPIDVHEEAKYAPTKSPTGANTRGSKLWVTDTHALSSILTLWLFSLELRKSTAVEATSNLRANIGDDVAQMDSRRNVYFRIVAPTTSETLNIQDRRNCSVLERWLSTDVKRLPSFSGTRQIVGWVDEDMEFMRTEASLWVVWGTNLSGYFDKKNMGSWFKDLGVLSRPGTTLENQCALELFSLFMEEIASRIEKVGGSTVHGAEAGGGGNRPYYINSFFDSIAHEVVAAGLAHDDREAYATITPAFFKRGLLPHCGPQRTKWPRIDGRQMIWNSLSIPDED